MVSHLMRVVKCLMERLLMKTGIKMAVKMMLIVKIPKI